MFLSSTPLSPSGTGLPLPLPPPPGVGTGVSRGVGGSFCAPDGPKKALCRPRWLPRWPQDGPDSVVMVQDGLRWLQDGKIKLPGAVQAWQKWHPVAARRRFSAKCMLLHRCLQDGPKEAPKCPKLIPRWPQYGSKMAQERPQRASRGVFSCPRGVGKLCAPQCLGRWPRGFHKDGPRWPPDGPRWPQNGLNTAPRSRQNDPKIATKVVDPRHQNVPL